MENQLVFVCLFFLIWGIIEHQSKFPIKGIDIIGKAFEDIKPLDKFKVNNKIQETKLLEVKKTR